MIDCKVNKELEVGTKIRLGYNQLCQYRKQVISMIDNSWIETSKIDWVEDDIKTKKN